jgi:hypothetical protein
MSSVFNLVQLTYGVEVVFIIQRSPGRQNALVTGLSILILGRYSSFHCHRAAWSTSWRLRSIHMPSEGQHMPELDSLIYGVDSAARFAFQTLPGLAFTHTLHSPMLPSLRIGVVQQP